MAAGDDTADPLLGAANPEVWGDFEPRPQGFDALRSRFYEAPVPDPRLLQVWCYTDRLSYQPGAIVSIHGCASRAPVALTIHRDDLGQTPIAILPMVSAPFQMPPAEFAAAGCGWPVIARWPVPADLASGFYILRARISDAAGGWRSHGC